MFERLLSTYHCVESVRIQSFSGSYFRAFGLNTESICRYSVRMLENTDQKNSKYGYFSRSVYEASQVTAYTDL